MDQQSCRLVARFNIDLNQGIIINRTKYTKCNDIFKKNKEKTLLLGSDLKHSINYILVVPFASYTRIMG